MSVLPNPLVPRDVLDSDDTISTWGVPAFSNMNWAILECASIWKGRDVLL